MFERYLLTDFKDQFWSQYYVNMSVILPFIDILNEKYELFGEGSQDGIYNTINMEN